jgi:hypothetical protein
VELSSRNGQGLDAWCSWLEAEWRELEQQFIAHAG